MYRLVLVAFLLSCAKAPAPEAPSLTYPDARRGEVVDDYHGTTVADPYRWLEDPDSEETRAWVTAENVVTESYLSGIEQREAIRARLTEVWNFERFGTPSKAGERYLWSHNSGLQDQSVIYVADSLDSEARVLIDPNTFSEDGTRALAGSRASWNGQYLAYAISDGGSDWKTWYIRDIETGEDLGDEIHWSKFSGPTWSHDDSGFYYSRYPEPENPLEAVNEYNQLYYHQLGTPQSQDVLILDNPEMPQQSFGAQVTEDGEWLFVYVSESTANKNRLYVQSLTEEGATLEKTWDDNDAAYSVLGNVGERVWLYTNKDAPKGRIVSTNLSDPHNWTEIIPEGEETMDGWGANLVGGKLILQLLQDAHTVVRVHTREGELIEEVELPGIGSAWGFGGKQNATESFYAYSSFTTPTRLYRYDIESGESTLWKESGVSFDVDAYTVSQVFYESKDGTRVPMFIAHKEGIELDGNNPTLLYGYGGFNISLTPWFSVTRMVWMEMGGVLAIPNLRGGGEYGEDWHYAGTKLKKQNVFDDFIAAAEYLVGAGYTRPEKLAIQGGSNGGLLVGATMTQRPDLVKAALPAVGVMDMLRYHGFTIGHAWADDYGRSDDSPEMFQYLLGYSPVHNLEPGTTYPSTMVTTADHDDRVVPAHSFKFAAALQHAHGGTNPVLIRIETRAGHGAGKSTAMRIAEYTDLWSFLVGELEMSPSLPEVPAAPEVEPIAPE
jgi:prolyl oligopeptidase